MKRFNKLVIAGALGAALTASTLSPAAKAESNVLLASVEWVNSLINPLQSKVTSLEAKVAQQQSEINALRTAIQNGAQPPAAVPSQVYVSPSTVKIHSGAATSYKVVSQKVKGDLLAVSGKYDASTGIWYLVKTSSTGTGWIFSGNVSTSQVAKPTSVVAKAKLTMRKGAASSYGVVAYIASGTTVKYVGSFSTSTGELWLNVQNASGQRGWILNANCEVK
ncbi:SH3 domain-containing protein [Fictibacillus iocasae]|uniref:SH3 domain-containing protein n=1 Tax=Fictibacillus iocasae TaxID=2715437 RepID=A0ABW2NYL3_9BACL